MGLKVAITGNGDTTLASDLLPGIITIAWTTIGDATVKIYGRITARGETVEFPLADGEFDKNTNDEQDNDLKSINIQVGRLSSVFAKVTGFSVPFSLWIA